MSAEPEAQTEAIDPVGHIVRTPGVMSGRPRIAGTRVRVSDVASHHFHHRLTVPEIADQLVVSEAGSTRRSRISATTAPRLRPMSETMRSLSNGSRRSFPRAW